MRPPQTIIKRPLLTEKSTRLRETGGGDFVYGEEEESDEDDEEPTGFVGPMVVRRAWEGRVGFCLDPVALGITLIDDDLGFLDVDLGVTGPGDFCEKTYAALTLGD